MEELISIKSDGLIRLKDGTSGETLDVFKSKNLYPTLVNIIKLWMNETGLVSSIGTKFVVRGWIGGSLCLHQVKQEEEKK